MEESSRLNEAAPAPAPRVFRSPSRNYLLSLCLYGLALAPVLAAPPVVVSVSLDKPTIAVGEKTTVRVFAQIAESQRANATQIFSWYVDLLNLSGAVAKLDGNGVARPASDNDPRTSSSGITVGADRRGLYDTFLNLPQAGRTAPIELVSIPVQGISPGRARLHVQAGTGVAGLAADFIVAPADGGDPLLGGDYSNAGVDVEVIESNQATSLAAAAFPLPNNQGLAITLTFAVVAGRSYVVEFRDSLGGGPEWQSLPGGPHNSGSVTDTTTVGQRFYRVRVAGL